MNLFDQLHPQWQQLLESQSSLITNIEKRIKRNNVTPSFENILAAYQLPPEDIKVIIIGQDPYPTPGYAHGLAFSVSQDTQPLPASLRNIFKELQDDCNIPAPSNGDLHRWSEQGVFLLNQTLTTTPGLSLSHEDFGWQALTSLTAKILGERDVIGVFWGKKAYELSKYFNPKLTIASPHPSPLSAYRGFFGSKPFSKVNEMLRNQGKTQVNW